MSKCACRSPGTHQFASGSARTLEQQITCPQRVRVFTPARRFSSRGLRRIARVVGSRDDRHGVLEGRQSRQGARCKDRGMIPTVCIAATETGVNSILSERLVCTDAAVEKWAASKTVDVTTLGNLCVDIVLNVPQLPPKSDAEKFQYMQRLVASPPDESYWEGGGNANVVIAGARLGLNCVTLGHVGNENFGRFLHRVLDKEGVQRVAIQEDGLFPRGDGDYDGSTLLCWVLVDPQHRHAFCSRFDFNENPALNHLRKLSASAEACIRRSRALFMNGYVFDELAPSVVVAAMRCAQEAGGAVFFDPGPRVYTFFRSPPQQRRILEQLLHASDVILLTSDEAEAVTGIADSRTSAKSLLGRGKTTKWVVVKMGAAGCLIATTKGFYHAPAFKVEVADTVGCGDSFAAAIMLGFTKWGSVPITTTLVLANAVGAATAMGQGAGRNVASAGKVLELLASAQEHCSHLSCEEHISDGSVTKVPMREAARDALKLLNSVLDKSHNKGLTVWQ